MSTVCNLFALSTERRETLKQFYADQATFFMQQIANPSGGAAALSIAVTGDDQVLTKMASVDAVHAAILVWELDTVRAQLVQFVTENAPELLEKINGAGAQKAKASNVVPLRKVANGDAQVIALRR